MCLVPLSCSLRSGLNGNFCYVCFTTKNIHSQHEQPADYGAEVEAGGRPINTSLEPPSRVEFLHRVRARLSSSLEREGG